MKQRKQSTGRLFFIPGERVGVAGVGDLPGFREEFFEGENHDATQFKFRTYFSCGEEKLSL